jgi:small subunit ribosomal protein S17
MAKEKKQMQGEGEASGNREGVLGICSDKLCPFHGVDKIKLRGRTFEGTVIKKLHGRVTIAFERSLFVPKYERFEKRRTKLHARLPDCLKKEINVGDYIQIEECRTLSKIIHAIVTKKIRGATEKEEKLVEAVKEKEEKKKVKKENTEEEEQ